MEEGHQCSSGLLNDYCDGKAFMKNPLFSMDRKAIQIFLYYDELEICNPLGSKVKIHKLGLCAYMHTKVEYINIVFTHRCFLFYNW